MRYQDPESTQPREPTLAEQRARIAAEKRREEELAAAERKSEMRRRIMVGSGVTVGVVALVAAFYSASAYSAEKNSVTQYCASEDGSQAVAAQDQYCDENYVTSHHGWVDHHTGMFFMPVILPGGGMGTHAYRYGYTDPGASAPGVGTRVTAPNFTKPSGSTIKSTSGSTVQRGGFGISRGGSSGS